MFCIHLSTLPGKSHNRIVRVLPGPAELNPVNNLYCHRVIDLATGQINWINALFLRPAVAADWQLKKEESLCS